MTFIEENVIIPVTLTASAAQAVQEIMTQKKLQGYALRLYIANGGCSGYQYGLSLANNIRPEDNVFETDGVRLIIDEVSIQFLQGATVDYVSDGEVNGFKITNPNPMPSCNCGPASSSTGEEGSNSCPDCA